MVKKCDQHNDLKKTAGYNRRMVDKLSDSFEDIKEKFRKLDKKVSWMNGKITVLILLLIILMGGAGTLFFMALKMLKESLIK